MKAEQLITALEAICPTAVWNLRGDTYDGLEWLDRTIPRPSLVEIEQWITQSSYISLREKAYPSTKDQLDAIWKGEPYLSEMRAKVLEVKQKYPKP